MEVISNDSEMVRRLIGKFADRSVLAACYEAGPGGYELYRLLAAAGVACDVVAPAMAVAWANPKPDRSGRSSPPWAGIQSRRSTWTDRLGTPTTSPGLTTVMSWAEISDTAVSRTLTTARRNEAGGGRTPGPARWH